MRERARRRSRRCSRSPSASTIVPGGGRRLAVRTRRAIADRSRMQRACRRMNVKACGHGCRPRIRLWMRAPASVQSIDAVVLRQPVRVGRQRFVLRRLVRRAGGDADRRSSTSSRAPSRARSRSTSSLVSSGPIGTARRRQHRPGVERLDHAHDRDAGLGSPAMTARCTGAAPRYRGSSEAWTLIIPSRGIARTASVRILP